MVVDEYAYRGVERILRVTRRDNTRAVVLAGNWSASKNLISFRLDPTTHLVEEPKKLVKLVVTFICCQNFRRDEAVKQGLCEFG